MAIFNEYYLLNREIDCTGSDLILDESYFILNESKVGDIINKIKPHKELNRYIADIQYADEFLSSKTEIKSKTQLEKVLMVGINILHVVATWTNFIKSMSSKVPNIPHIRPFESALLLVMAHSLIQKAINTAVAIGEQKVIISQGTKLLSAYDEAIKSTTDEELVRKLKNKRDMIEIALRDLKK